ncbi:hypothetical protein QVD17_13627 [Tagetes erecta]|uniref:RING-type E3 ubiquitin transferase n=1 Tax=Tagetes erecta TaxID=13708 RepID=A0AAD8L2E0_TARER|nr:hypothetical protein QVD17_13627 [Tagetes erecta]
MWCKYIILPSPPPPPPPPVNHSLGGATLSPVVIVIITVIGTFVLLIGYYYMMSKYCSRNYESSVLLRQRVDHNVGTGEPELGVDGHDQVDDHSNHVPWIVLSKGLDEDVIKSIRVCKYKKDDGFVTSTDCSVCLGEFEEDESVKLLPKCSHAFHVYCIDTWLKTHLNCPLCRANVRCDVKPSQPVSPQVPLPHDHQ